MSLKQCKEIPQARLCSSFSFRIILIFILYLLLTNPMQPHFSLVSLLPLELCENTRQSTIPLRS